MKFVTGHDEVTFQCILPPLCIGIALCFSLLQYFKDDSLDYVIACAVEVDSVI